MACEIVRAPGAVFSVWGVPEVSDVERLEGAFRAAVDEAGSIRVYVTRVPADAPAPEGECRKRLNAALAEWMKLCSSYHVVLEGQGFVAAFKRGVLTNLLQPFWRPKVVFVHARCEDIVASVRAEEVAAVRGVLRIAEARGLTEGSLGAGSA